MAFGAQYGIRINNVRDRASTPNAIATNTLVSFVAEPFASEDIGNSPVASSTTYTSNGLVVTALGSGIGGSADQFNFEYQLRSGDFDVEARLDGISPSDVFARGGLMARESLTSGGRFAASFATPAMNGCFFEFRDPANSSSTSAEISRSTSRKHGCA